MSLQLQVEAQCVVEVHHDVGGGPPEDCTDPFDGDGADLLGLGFRILPKTGLGGG